MSALPIIVKQNSPSVGLFTHAIADKYREGKLKRTLKREFKSTWNCLEVNTWTDNTEKKMKIFIFCVVICGILALTHGKKPKVKTSGCVGKCGNKQLGYFQSCDSCEEYVTCVHGIKYDRTCPDGLKWHDTLKRCQRTTPVKFLDRRKTNYCESICQECFH